MKRVRPSDVAVITAALTAGAEPKAPKGGRGLILRAPGNKHRKLIDTSGNLTSSGKWYYEALGTAAPVLDGWGINEPVKRGNTESIKLTTGGTVRLRSWDPVKGDWVFYRRWARVLQERCRPLHCSLSDL